MVNNQPQGLALVSFEDTYTDHTQNPPVENQKCQVEGVDGVLKGSQIVILEGGLGWFDKLNDKYTDDKKIFSIFISPYSHKFLEEVSTNHGEAIQALLGREIALEIHRRECRDAQAIKEDIEILRTNYNISEQLEIFRKKLKNLPEDAADKIFSMIDEKPAEEMDIDEYTQYLNKQIADAIEALGIDKEVLEKVNEWEGGTPDLERFRTSKEAWKVHMIHQIGYAVAHLRKDLTDKIESVGERKTVIGDLNNAELFAPTPQDEFVNRVVEAVRQELRRNEYSTVLITRRARSEEEFGRIISGLMEDVAQRCFAHVFTHLGKGYLKAFGAYMPVQYKDLQDSYDDTLECQLDLG